MLRIKDEKVFTLANSDSAANDYFMVAFSFCDGMLCLGNIRSDKINIISSRYNLVDIEFFTAEDGSYDFLSLSWQIKWTQLCVPELITWGSKTN